MENFKKIEELYCDDVVRSCVYYKSIAEIKQKNKPEDLFTGSILEKNLFDKALTSVNVINNLGKIFSRKRLPGFKWRENTVW